MTELRTEAGRRLLAREAYNSRSFALITAEAILAIEAEAAAGPLTPEEYERLTTFTSDDWSAKREAEAAAGPRDEGLDVERLARAMQNVEDELTATNIAYEYAALAKADAAAGPEPESPASAWLEGYKRGRIEAEASRATADQGDL